MFRYFLRIFVLLLAWTSCAAAFAQISIRLQSDRSSKLLTLKVTNLSDSLYCHFSKPRHSSEYNSLTLKRSTKRPSRNFVTDLFVSIERSQEYTIPPGQSTSCTYLCLPDDGVDTVEVGVSILCFSSMKPNLYMRNPQTETVYQFDLSQTLTRENPIHLEAYLPFSSRSAEKNIKLTNLFADRVMVYKSDKTENSESLRPGESVAMQSESEEKPGRPYISGSFYVVPVSAPNNALSRMKPTGHLSMYAR